MARRALRVEELVWPAPEAGLVEVTGRDRQVHGLAEAVVCDRQPATRHLAWCGFPIGTYD